MRRARKKCTAIILAAGQGKRMGGKVQKQYLELTQKYRDALKKYVKMIFQ